MLERSANSTRNVLLISILCSWLSSYRCDWQPQVVSAPGQNCLVTPGRRGGTEVDAALEVCSELGFGQASMSEIAARASVSKATLCNYFESKEEMFTPRRTANRLCPSQKSADRHVRAAGASVRGVMPQLWRTKMIQESTC
ncbi:helix-turn-helix domain-containing protein [Paraburkholderia tuberum]|uniref:TetR/AcrR family transcriptional regulator n=1 Tax=Paraburkholderia TaxID=1822464 RepID=UPI0009FC83C3